MAIQRKPSQRSVGPPNADLPRQSTSGAAADGLRADAQFRQMIDAMPVLAWTARPDGSVDFFNAPWLTYTGLSEPEALEWAWMSAIHPDDQASVAERWRSAVATGAGVDIELRLRRFDGEYRWFLIRANAVRDDIGRIQKWCGTNTEIEDRWRAEQVARDSEHSLRLIIDSVPGLLFTMTPAGEVEFVSRTLLNYFGKPLNELKDWAASDAIHPEDLPKTMGYVRDGIESGHAFTFDQRLRHASGVYRWFQFGAVPLHDATGRVTRWYGLLTDMDDLKRAEESLRRTQARLSRATHLATVSELSASIAHEVNQPLAAVVANGDACRRWLSADPPNVERALISADRIVRDGNAAADVVRRVRSLFQQAPLIPEPLDLNEVIEEVLGLLSADLRHQGIALLTRLQLDLPRVMADRVQMQQVLVNLARNGAEAMEGVDERVKVLTVMSRRSGDEVFVEISDHGVGITENETLFEPFHTTKAQGMGMGLAICRSIVDAHHGRLWAMRNQPHGSTFGFALGLGSDIAPASRDDGASRA
jgi:PAS domain S-box-containing protein